MAEKESETNIFLMSTLSHIPLTFNLIPKFEINIIIPNSKFSSEEALDENNQEVTC